MSSKKVVCFGEVLWDSLPGGLFLGGAPLNVALNLNNLGVDTTIISAVGNDKLGNQALKSIEEKGLEIHFIQHNNYPTGFVDVEVDEKGDAGYTIHKPAAWDYITWTNELQVEVDRSGFMVFGSLVFRNEVSRNTLQKLISSYKGKTVVDVNLREPFYSKDLIDEVLSFADIAKINHDELEIIIGGKKASLPDKEAMIYLSELYGLEVLLLTRGEEGAVLFENGKFQEKPRFKVKVKDTVGSGDAFLAGAIFSFIQGKIGGEVIAFANALGAFVASRDGATPNFDMNEIEALLKEISFKKGK